MVEFLTRDTARLSTVQPRLPRGEVHTQMTAGVATDVGGAARRGRASRQAKFTQLLAVRPSLLLVYALLTDIF